MSINGKVVTCILSFIWDWYKNLKNQSCLPENLRFWWWNFPTLRRTEPLSFNWDEVKYIMNIDSIGLHVFMLCARLAPYCRFLTFTATRLKNEKDSIMGPKWVSALSEHELVKQWLIICWASIICHHFTIYTELWTRKKIRKRVTDKNFRFWLFYGIGGKRCGLTLNPHVLTEETWYMYEVQALWNFHLALVFWCRPIFGLWQIICSQCSRPGSLDFLNAQARGTPLSYEDHWRKCMKLWFIRHQVTHIGQGGRVKWLIIGGLD